MTLGVEEEFHVVDLETRRVAPRGPQVLGGLPEDSFAAELQRSVVEANSAVVDRLEDLRHELLTVRNRLAASAERVGAGIVSAGSAPLVDPAELGVTADTRYARMLADYQLLVREQVICGTQIHIGIDDRDLAVAAASRVSPDLPVLLALSASSPYWLGVDTGYASYRTFVWSRWPTAGPFGEAADAAEYDALVSDLIRTGVVSDVGMMYFDVRPSAHVPTLELRLCDACPRVDDVQLIAGLFRALVRRACEDLAAGRPPARIAPELIRAATWRAARAGLEGDLVDIQRRSPYTVQRVVRRLISELREPLEAAGDWELVTSLADQALRGGSSAARQRAAYRRRAELSDVVDLLLRETCPPDVSWPVQPSSEDTRSLFDRYTAPPGDEMVDLERGVRPLSRPVIDVLERLGSAALLSREVDRDRHQADREVTFLVEGETRPFPIDLVPRIVPLDEWRQLERGIAQRALALEAFLADVYGPRTAVQEGIVPETTLESCPGLRPAGVFVPDGAVRANVIGVDMVRDADGNWRVLEDNLRVPSGLAYAMHARHMLASVMSELVPPAGTLEVDAAADVMSRALRTAAPEGPAPHVRLALFTAGPSDSAYWEHRTLADRLDADLVQPKDLIVTDSGVYRQEFGRRFRLDVIYRRFDEDQLDHAAGADGRPLGRRLLSAVRNGTVALANTPGNGVGDDKAIYAYVPDLIEHFLGEKPLLDGVATLRCADPEQRREVLARLPELVVKPVDGYGGAGVVIGPAASGPELAAVRRQVLLAPQRWIAQEVVRVSTSPTVLGGLLEPRHVDLRVFVVLSRSPAGGAPQAEVLPAPLTRVAPSGSLVVNSSRGGGAKDTWLVP